MIGQRHKYSLALDFDGVIHHDIHPWEGPAVIKGPPVVDQVTGVSSLAWMTVMSKDFNLVINSARLSEEDGTTNFEEVKAAMQAWFLRNGLDPEVLKDIQYHAKPRALIYLDDRGVRFEGDNFPTKDEIHHDLRPWVDPVAGGRKTVRQLKAQLQHLKQRIADIVPYVTATLSPGNRFPSAHPQRAAEWVEVHGGRAGSSKVQLENLLRESR